MILVMRVAFWEGNKTCFLDFLFLTRFSIFQALLHNLDQNCTIITQCPTNGKSGQNQKSKIQVLFPSQNATLMTKIIEIGLNGKALLLLED